MRARGTCKLILIATFWSKIYFLKFAYSALYKLLYVRYGYSRSKGNYEHVPAHTHICVCPTQKSIWQMENKSTWFRLNGSALWLLPKCIFGMRTNNIQSKAYIYLFAIRGAYAEIYYTYMAKAISSNITCVRLRCDSYTYMYWIYNYKL